MELEFSMIHRMVLRDKENGKTESAHVGWTSEYMEKTIKSYTENHCI